LARETTASRRTRKAKRSDRGWGRIARRPIAGRRVVGALAFPRRFLLGAGGVVAFDNVLKVGWAERVTGTTTIEEEISCLCDGLLRADFGNARICGECG